MEIRDSNEEQRFAADPIRGLHESALEVQSAARFLESLFQQTDLLPLTVREVAAGLGRSLQVHSHRIVVGAELLRDVQSARLLVAKTGDGELSAAAAPPPPAAPSEDQDDDASGESNET
jgi:hypothetical protein